MHYANKTVESQDQAFPEVFTYFATLDSSNAFDHLSKGVQITTYYAGVESYETLNYGK